jgi:phosphate transport system ATP-binding protein
MTHEREAEMPPYETASAAGPITTARPLSVRPQVTPSMTLSPGQDDHREAPPTPPSRLQIRNLSVWYGSFRAIRDIDLDVADRAITAIIGPSGCGKSTLLRAINRMTDLVPNARAEGQILLDGENLLDPRIDVVEVRRRIGMVFQQPNPFPKSVYDNVAYGPRLYGVRGRALDEVVERSLRAAALWDEVKDKLRQSAYALSGGQQQRLCIARALAVEPEIILMDEPTSALDPKATLQIEELMADLKEHYTIIIVTHNIQQAARISDYTAFLSMGEDRAGYLVEYDVTTTLFTNPKNRLTEDYISGRFG